MPSPPPPPLPPPPSLPPLLRLLLVPPPPPRPPPPPLHHRHHHYHRHRHHRYRHHHHQQHHRSHTRSWRRGGGAARCTHTPCRHVAADARSAAADGTRRRARDPFARGHVHARTPAHIRAGTGDPAARADAMHTLELARRTALPHRDPDPGRPLPTAAHAPPPPRAPPNSGNSRPVAAGRARPPRRRSRPLRGVQPQTHQRSHAIVAVAADEHETKQRTQRVTARARPPGRTARRSGGPWWRRARTRAPRERGARVAGVTACGMHARDPQPRRLPCGCVARDATEWTPATHPPTHAPTRRRRTARSGGRQWGTLGWCRLADARLSSPGALHTRTAARTHRRTAAPPPHEPAACRAARRPPPRRHTHATPHTAAPVTRVPPRVRRTVRLRSGRPPRRHAAAPARPPVPARPWGQRPRPPPPARARGPLWHGHASRRPPPPPPPPPPPARAGGSTSTRSTHTRSGNRSGGLRTWLVYASRKWNTIEPVAAARSRKRRYSRGIESAPVPPRRPRERADTRTPRARTRTHAHLHPHAHTHARMHARTRAPTSRRPARTGTLCPSAHMPAVTYTHTHRAHTARHARAATARNTGVPCATRVPACSPLRATAPAS